MVLEEFWNQRQLNCSSVTFNVVPTQISYYFRKWDKIVVTNEEKTTLLGPWIKVNLCLFCFMFLAVPTIVPKALYLAKNTLPLKYSVCPFCCYVFLISFWDRVSLCSLGKPSAFCPLASASGSPRIIGMCHHTGPLMSVLRLFTLNQSVLFASNCQVETL